MKPGAKIEAAAQARTPALEIHSVSKSFAKPLLEGASMRLEAGRGAILAGPNGSGKSTLLKMITGVLLPDSGSILVGGEPGYPTRRISLRLGYCPSSAEGFYRRLSARQNLRHFGALYRLSPAKVDAFVARQRIFEIDYWEQPAERLSDGMLQKLKILRAFMHDPGLAILDEPLNFLDRAAQRAFKDWLGHWVLERPGRAYLATQHSAELSGERWEVRDRKLARIES